MEILFLVATNQLFLLKSGYGNPHLSSPGQFFLLHPDVLFGCRTLVVGGSAAAKALDGRWGASKEIEWTWT